MLFSVLNRRVPLRLQIWDYRFIFSDRPLGHIELDLRPLQDLRLYDVWLPLLVLIAYLLFSPPPPDSPVLMHCYRAVLQEKSTFCASSLR